jgi:hypothetical protein
MSNSSRIEVATRQHVNAVLTSEQIVELVKLSDPTNSKGIYPSDCAGKRLEDGTLTFRGKVAYGDLVLELVGPNSYKVLPTEQIVRRPGSAKKEVKAAAPVAAPVPAPAAIASSKADTGKKKAGKSASQPASIHKSTKRVAQLQ